MEKTYGIGHDELQKQANGICGSLNLYYSVSIMPVENGYMLSKGSRQYIAQDLSKALDLIREWFEKK